MFGTAEGKELVDSEHTPPGYLVLKTEASDQEIDARVKMGASTTYQPVGTATIRTVVDGSLRVYGVKNLRVADVSIVSCLLYMTLTEANSRQIPKPLAAHYQVPVYC